ncbi:MAG TPA: HD domain-containing phosphohydrolase [Gaiellaceae bacterium]|nr:HD domain-containing phosphohydrolase [Gaiellaceae bacterium]
MTLLGDLSIFRRLSHLTADVDRATAIYIAAVLVAAGTTTAGLIAAGFGVASWYAVIGLAAVAALCERGSIRLRHDLTISISLLPAVFAAVLFGPLGAMIVFGASSLALAFPPAARLTYLATRSMTGAASAGAAAVVADSISEGVGRTIAASMAAALVAELADAVFASIAFQVRKNGSWRVLAREALPITIASVPLYGPAVGLLALAYRNVSPWTLPLFFGPALAAQRWWLMYQDQRRLAEDLRGVNEQLRDANLSFAKGLIATLDARDRYTAGHSAAVAIYARDIATRMGLTEAQEALAYLCGLVHDIGKIGLPAGLLEKPGALTLEERREMQRHAEIGERILGNVETYAEIASVVRHHHERFDGQGYPDGIANTDIPLLSRIIAVADAYNAMTSDRPYRDAMPSRVARLRLAQAVETQFDTAVVAAFEAILAGATEDYRLAQGEVFKVAAPTEASGEPALQARTG